MPGEKAFDCRRCGHCCQGEGGIVLTSRDQARLAEHLGLGLQGFIDSHTSRKGEKLHLGVRENGFCIFFQDGCGVHPARPDICRAWPFFRGNLLDASSWELSQDYCAGINRDLPHEEFVRQGLDELKSQDVRQFDEPGAPHALRLDGIVKP